MIRIILSLIAPLLLTMCQTLPEETPMAIVSRQMLRDEFGGPKAGEIAPIFRARDLNGKRITFPPKSRKPTVLILGCYSCPIFRTNVPGVTALHRDFGDKVNFAYLYTIEAHPVGSHSPYKPKEWVTRPNRSDGVLIPQPASLKERLALAKTARDELKITWPVIIDDMQNPGWIAYGKTPSSAYLISADGKVLLRQAWVNPAALKKHLLKLSEK